MKNEVVQTLGRMLLIIGLLAIMSTLSAGATNEHKNEEIDMKNLAQRRNATIGRGMNFGNALEAPNEGDWGFVIKESYIEALARSGFDSVRLPICWSAHLTQEKPYPIDPAFMARIDEIIGWCFDRNLAVIITIHHFNKYYDHPEDPVYHAQLLSIWKQLTGHYVSYDHDRLIFELLNEPHSKLTPEKWNAVLPELLDTVRQLDRNRTLIIDTPNWAHHIYLNELKIPEEEKNVIVSVRYYLPYPFTHQGAHWSEGSDKWLGLTWRATDSEKEVVDKDMDMIKTWSDKHSRPITVGEWGSIEKADQTSRLIWTRYVREKMEANGFSWSYFDFGYLFKVYDIEKNTWLDGLEEALTH